MRFGMCNEHLNRPIEETFARLADLGYGGVEVTPWTFTDDVANASTREVERIRDAARQC